MSISAAQVKELREKTGVGMMECKNALSESGGDMEKAILFLRERGLSRAAKKAGRTTAEGIVQVLVSADKSSGVAIEVNCETDFVSKNADFIKFAADIAKIALAKSLKSTHDLNEATMDDGIKVSAKITQLISTIGENINLRRLTLLTAKNGTVAGYSHMGGKIGTLVVLDGSKGADIDSLAVDLAMHCAAASPRYLTSQDVDPAELEQEQDLARKKLREQGKTDDLIDKIMGGQMSKFFKEVCFLDQAFVKDSKFSVEKLIKDLGKGAVLSAYCRFQLGEGIEKRQEDFAAEVAAAAAHRS